MIPTYSEENWLMCNLMCRKQNCITMFFEKTSYQSHFGLIEPYQQSNSTIVNLWKIVQLGISSKRHWTNFHQKPFPDENAWRWQISSRLNKSIAMMIHSTVLKAQVETMSLPKPPSPMMQPHDKHTMDYINLSDY